MWGEVWRRAAWVVGEGEGGEEGGEGERPSSPLPCPSCFQTAAEKSEKHMAAVAEAGMQGGKDRRLVHHGRLRTLASLD